MNFYAKSGSGVCGSVDYTVQTFLFKVQSLTTFKYNRKLHGSPMENKTKSTPTLKALVSINTDQGLKGLKLHLGENWEDLQNIADIRTIWCRFAQICVDWRIYSCKFLNSRTTLLYQRAEKPLRKILPEISPEKKFSPKFLATFPPIQFSQEIISQQF